MYKIISVYSREENGKEKVFNGKERFVSGHEEGFSEDV